MLSRTVSQFLFELVQGRFDVFPSLWEFRPGRPQLFHGRAHAQNVATSATALCNVSWAPSARATTTNLRHEDFFASSHAPWACRAAWSRFHCAFVRTDTTVRAPARAMDAVDAVLEAEVNSIVNSRAVAGTFDLP